MCVCVGMSVRCLTVCVCIYEESVCVRAVPLLRERGLPGLLFLREPDLEGCELHLDASSTSELDDSPELDDDSELHDSENGLLLSRVAF